MTCLYPFLTRDEDIFITMSCRDILRHYGAEAQRDQLAEECAEFSAARWKNHKRPSPEAEEHEMDELADVIVMLEQRVQMLSPAEGRHLAQHVMVKIDRQLARIGQEQDAASHRDIEHGC